MTSFDVLLQNLARAKTDVQRCDAACRLKSYIAGDLQEEGTEKYNNFVDKLNHKIVDLSNSSDVNDKKAAVLAIVALIEADSKSSSQPHRYNKSLTTINQTNDDATLRLSTWAIGRLARAEGNLYDRFIEPVMGKAFEILDEKVKSRDLGQDSRKMAAILTIREMAINAPTCFFQKLDNFLDLIVKVLRDAKKEIRFAAVAALRASLTIVSQRETSLQGHTGHVDENILPRRYYQKLLMGAMGMLLKDDEVKGGIMIIIEMIRSATTRQDLLVYEENCFGGSEDISLLKIIGLSSLDREKKCLIDNEDPPDMLMVDQDSSPRNVLGEEGHHFSQQCRNLLKERNGEQTNLTMIGEMILKFKYSKNSEIQFLMTEVLPRLAAFDSPTFQEYFLSDTFNYLTTQAKGLKSSGSSPTAFLAIGQIAYSMQDGIICYIDKIFTVIKPYIPNPKELAKYRRNINSQVEGNVLQLISLLAKATKEKFQISIGDYIDGMLLMTLTKALTDCLAVLHANVPAVKEKIQDGLLNIFSRIIMSIPHFKEDKAYPVPPDYISPTDVASKLLAIKTIGTFKFDDKLLKPFITNLAKDYLNHNNPEIRRETAKTCARKLVPCVEASNTGVNMVGGWIYSSHTMMTDVLTKLLTVVVADPLPEIRLATLKEFNRDFYKQLALSENIQSLFLAVNDGSHEVREVVLELLGHLSEENPAYILPFLREQLSQILHQFEHSGIARNKEKAAKLLHILIKSAKPTLVKLYLGPIMSILQPKLKSLEYSSTLFRHILACISQLAEVDGASMSKYLDDLFPFLIQRISDPKEREPSLKAMYYLVRHTGYVVKPYEQYPDLLDTLLNIISTENSIPVRKDCMKLLGQLGALSPYKSNKEDINELRKFPITQPVPNEAVSFNTGLTSELLIQKQSDKEFNMDKQYYPCVVINALMNILQDRSLVQYHSQVVQIIITVFQRLGSVGTVGYLPKVMPTFLQNIENCDPRTLDSYFNKLADLTKIVGIHIKPYANDIIKLIIDYWGMDSDYQNTILMVVERLISALGGEFKTYIAKLIPLIMKVLHDDQSPSKTATKRLLSRLRNFGTTLDNYLHLLLPEIVAIIGNANNDMEIRMVAVVTLRDIAEYADYSEHASLMLHTLVRSLDGTNDMEFKHRIMDTVLAIARQLGDRFRIFKQLVMSSLSKQQLVVPEFESFVTQLAISQLVLPEVPPLEVPRLTDITGTESSVNKLPVDVDKLTNVWEVKNLFPKDLVRWLQKLKTEFLKYTPNPALRACCMLSHYQALTEDLFNAVFVSIWSDQLTEQQQDKLGENLRKVLENQSIPEVTLAILNLQEFMKHWGKGTLDIRNEVFAKAAKKCNSYAKALYYVECDFLQQEPGTLLELLRINNILQQPKAALGVLKYAQMNPASGKLNPPEDLWYEELQQWDEALHRYNDKLSIGCGNHVAAILGKLRCLEALNEWDSMQNTIDAYWNDVAKNHVNVQASQIPQPDHSSNKKGEQLSAMAGLGAAAAWRLSRWSDLSKYTEHMDMSYQKNFFSAVIAINDGNYIAAQELIDQSRETLDQEITVIVKEGYHRLYNKMVDMHMLCELEDVVAFKNCLSNRPREYKTESDNLKREKEEKSKLREIWWQRLQGCQTRVQDWSRILEVHKLVLSPREDERAWLKFSSIAQKNGRLDLAKRIMVTLIGRDPSQYDDPCEWLMSPMSPHVVYQYLKYQWSTARVEPMKRHALALMNSYVDHGLDNGDRNVLGQRTRNDVDRRLRAKYRLKQGIWLYQLNKSNKANPNPALDTLPYFREAKELDEQWYKSWHHWAMMNLHAAQPEKLKSLKDEYRDIDVKINQLQSGSLRMNNLDLDDDDEDYEFEDDEDIDSDDEEVLDDSIIRLPDPGPPQEVTTREISPHGDESDRELQEEIQELTRIRENLGQQLKHKFALIRASVAGFIESITLSLDTNLLQDILRLLTLWFTHGSNPDVNQVLKQGIMRIPIKTWIQVIPQLIARIDIPERSVRELIHQVIKDVGREHPQALIYPLSVAKKSGEGNREIYASELLKLMREHTPQIVEEGTMFSNELIRIAISWNEQWHEALEKASTIWYNENNAKGMFEILSPMHKMINPEQDNPAAVLTDLEKSFNNANGRDLADAYELCKRYQQSDDPKDKEKKMLQVWDCYFKVYKKTQATISQLNTVRLEDGSPILLNEARDMDLAVPGTYDPGQQVIKIHSIKPSVGIIKSKQRPRKLSMMGSDGKTYTFLLKGNEDLRQDERAMQLFGLVNSLLAHSQTTSQQNLCVQRYSVIPLSPNSGLSGWRPHGDTLHLLIKEHRERRKVTPTLETKLCNNFCLCYEKLPLMMKIEVFEEVLKLTKGEDLADILYQKSPSAEVWFERRKNYTLSHAVMSMVGYILGLGDRHPSNIMMDRKTGNLIHCDFGECFDVSRDREKYPEKIPFRLTRMMQKAMEVTGIHGTYTLTCNDVMEVLRTNENSILAVLETFVYDPLINWRLVQVEDMAEEGIDHSEGRHYDAKYTNMKALEILQKVKKKLTGYDDITDQFLDVKDQVQSLIKQATATENLCQLYMGWCPFW